MNPWHRLPPLRSLRVLEAAVRHENYTKAASELNLTHSAVSHQIHALEENLGTRLLERAGRQMRATDLGRQLALDVRVTLDTLAAAVERIRGNASSNAITISCLPSFASAWLVLKSVVSSIAIRISTCVWRARRRSPISATTASTSRSVSAAAITMGSSAKNYSTTKCSRP